MRGAFRLLYKFVAAVLLGALFTSVAHSQEYSPRQWRIYYVDMYGSIYELPGTSMASTAAASCSNASPAILENFGFAAPSLTIEPYKFNVIPRLQPSFPDVQPVYGHKCSFLVPNYPPHPAYQAIGWNSTVPLLIMGQCDNFVLPTLTPNGPRCNVGAGEGSPEADDCICDEGDTPIGSSPAPTAGNPIALDSGAKVEHAVDYSTADGLLTVKRDYRSLPRKTNLTRSKVEIAGFGENWHGLIPGRLVFYGSQMREAEYLAPSGTTKHFYSAGGEWSFIGWRSSRLALSMVSEPNVSRGEFFSDIAGPVNALGEAKLTFANGDYVLFRRASHYDASRAERYLFPVEHRRANGYAQWFEYSVGDDEFPNKIRDNLGREISIQWSEMGWSSTQVLGDRKGPNQMEPPVGMRQRKAVGALYLPDGTSLNYTYGAIDENGYLGRLEKVRRLDGAEQELWARSYLYEDERFSSAITGTLDLNGNRLSTYAYDDMARATLTERWNGVGRNEVTYSDPETIGGNYVRKVRDSQGLEMEYIFSGLEEASSGPGGPASRALPRRLLSVARAAPSGPQLMASAASPSIDHGYNSDGFIEKTTDANGNISTLASDEAGRPLSITDANGLETTLQWHPALDLVTRETKGNLQVDYVYDTAGRLLSRSETDISSTDNAGSRKSTFTWGESGRLLTINGPMNPAQYNGQDDITAFTYDTSGNRLTMTNPLGHAITYGAYDANGNPGKMIDANGVETEFGYDPMGRLSQILLKHPSDSAKDAATVLDHDVEGRVIGVTRPETEKLIFDYDHAGRMISMRSGDGERIDHAYDAMSNRVSETVIRGDQSQALAINRTFNELGRLVSEATGPGRETFLNYDPNGNVTEFITPRGNSFSQAFDAVNRLVSTTAPDTGVTVTVYNANDEVTSFTDPVSVQTSFVRNGFGEVIREISHDRGTIIYHYDAVGDLAAAIDGRGQRIDYTRDILGRVTAKTPVGRPPSETATFSYDSGGVTGCACVGRLASMTDASGTARFGYDHRGNLTAKVQTAGELAWSYDLADRIVEVGYPSGRDVAYTRDTKGRVTEVKTRPDSDSAWAVLATNIAYEPFGPLKSIDLGNGLKLSQDWGSDRRLASKRLYTAAGGDVWHLSYDYDYDDNITVITDHVTAANSRSFGYDSVDRLNRVDGGTGGFAREDYVHDKNGNLLRVERRVDVGDTSPTQSDVHAIASGTNRLSSVAHAAGTRSLTYDARGNLTADTRPAGAGVTLAYDGHARLASYARAGSETQAMLYNGFDERVSLTTMLGSSPVEARRFAYDPGHRIVGEYGATPSDLRAEYIWLLPEVGDGSAFGGDDGLGGYMPLAVAVPDGASSELHWVQGNHLGTPVITTDASGSPVTPTGYARIGFPGQVEQHSDLYYNYYRDYDPTLGRYVQADPIGLNGDVNPYGYVGGNPLRRVDPNGLRTLPRGWGVPIPIPGTIGPDKDGNGLNDWTEKLAIQFENNLSDIKKAIEDCFNSDDGACEAQKSDDELACNDWNIYGSRNGYGRVQGLAICFKTVMARYGECLARGNNPKNITTRLFTPIMRQGGGGADRKWPR